MRRVLVNSGGAGEKGLAEQNYHMRYEHKEVRNGVVGEGQDLSEEDESRINEVGVNLNDGREVDLQFQAQTSSLQQQPQGSAVHWERFLPLRTLKVLLVENDDSTRHVVSALLRNCSYEGLYLSILNAFTPVANGLQAWKTLQDLTIHIDLILSEVVMPCLSGIGLLGKIMNHHTCKNIPMIMMSSHDSMGIVFKCLSKGAVDFLVKPIRKNELKNLWQHVWRRCHSSSGSGSESGIQTKKSAKSKFIEESENNTGSNDEDNNGSIGLDARDGSDNGSGTQSSWTKKAVEVESPQPLLPWDTLGDPPDSTCAQLIHTKEEAFGNGGVPICVKDCQQQDPELLDNEAMGKDLEILVPRNPDLQHQNPGENKRDKFPEPEPEKCNEQLVGVLGLNREKPIGELRVLAAYRADSITNTSQPQLTTRNFELPSNLSKISETKDKTNFDAKELPSLDLSLKRPRGIKDTGTAPYDDRNVLRHSEVSAFSRYHTASTTTLGNVGSCSPVDNSSEAMYNNQRSNGSSNNIDMGSTTKSVFPNPLAFNEKSPSTSTARCLHPSAFQPLPQKADDVIVKAVAAHQQVEVQHHHHYYHHHHHHMHNMQQKQAATDNDDLSLNISSNQFGEPVDGNAGNYSLNGSISGSNNGSDKQNGSSKDMNAKGIITDSGNGVIGKGGVGDGSGRSGVDQNRFAQRVAALTKFRQKRKERCFEKKVRYQSRKKLAEQRPRVRGQFVRQKGYEDANMEADS
ncbi:hypothetical protein GIB67_018543 [Kingdonia uniflora]|uniref:Two-component response regulator-like PRR37 n=1 Tax=Kingdonia uniflora TaxID=39325 RepID=A0A7J7LWJ0_9MAGN|nr:hypothetical protein GIB67_018543 [Kingdonia uniflora]